MAFASVFRGLGVIYLTLAALAFAAALLALGMGEAAGAFLGVGSLAAFVGGAGFLIARSVHGDPGPREAVALLLAAWATTPAIASFPFLGAPGLASWGDAYFEAMVALTTTGPGLLDVTQAPGPLLIYRALLEWGGGFLSVTLILIILAALSLPGPGGRRFAAVSAEQGALFRGFGQIVRAAAIVYALATLAGFIILAGSGVPTQDALYLALTAPATSGGLPRPEPLSDYVPAVGRLALALAMFAGALNFALIWQSRRDPAARGELWRDPETTAFIVGAAVIAVLLMSAGAGAAFAPLNAVHDAIALVSTTARFADPEAVRALPAILILVITFVGGSSISMAGGVKIIRMLLLFKHVWVELRRVSHPSSVVPMTFRGRRLAQRAFVSLWIYFLGYTGALGALILAVTLAGADFAAAAAASVAALSNAGGVLGVTTPQALGFGDFPPAARWWLALGMALGRMEVLAFVAAFTPGLWRR